MAQDLSSPPERIEGMIECPNCKHKEIPGALTCSVCGAQLVSDSKPDVETMRVDQTDKLAILTQAHEQPPIPPPPTDVAISLFVLEAGAILPLEGQTEYTLGRSSEGQPMLPDVDLAAFQAYEHGVSRIHALITLGEQEVMVTDLASSNGTRLNGLRIAPHRPTPVEHGDILSMGKLKIQILIRR